MTILPVSMPVYTIILETEECLRFL